MLELAKALWVEMQCNTQNNDEVCLSAIPASPKQKESTVVNVLPSGCLVSLGDSVIPGA